MAEKLRLHTAKTTRIEMAPWAKAYTVDVKDIYTDLSMEKIENEPTGPEGKIVKDYKELFEGSSEQTTEMSEKKTAKKVLMKADPGMGKTTFGKHLAYDWAKGVFTAFTIVFFVSLKLVRPGDAIENIIIQQTPVLAGLGVKQEQIGKILNTFSSRCLIIFDGYDEFKSKNEDIIKIIEGRKLFHCNILLTSRPHNVENIEEFFSTIVVIQGFSEIHTSQYISKVLKGPEKIQAVLKFNKNNFMADRKLFTCPMLILFICILANHDELDLTRKNVALGEIYWRLLRSIYRKYCEKAGVQFIHSYFIDVVTRVSFLAYRMFGLEQTCFQRSDIPEVEGEDIFEYGFLIGYEDYKLVGREDADIAVGFPHDTIGEFFAAFCEMYRLNNCHWIENFFLQHTSLLHFCLWLITDLQLDIGFDKKATLEYLEKDLLKEYNTTTLDLNTLVKTRLDVYRKTNDGVILNFIKSLLSKCDKVKHLVLSIAAPVNWIIDSLGSTVDQLSTVWITDRYYNYDDPVRDSVRHGFLSSGIIFILDVEAEHSDEGESYGQLKAMATELPGRAAVNLVVMTTRIKQRIDVPEVLLPRFKKVCLGAQGRDCGRLLAFASFEIRGPLNVTHLSFVRCNIHANAFNLLSLAAEKHQLECLSYLSFVDCEVKGKLLILFECVWPALTHLSFHQTFLDESDLRHLTDCLTGSRFLPRLKSLVLCFSDELDDEYGHEKKGLMAPLNNVQLMSTWRRPVDLLLQEIVKAPLEGLTSLWLEDLNKEEYKTMITVLNARRPSCLSTLGISMWKHARLHKYTAVFVRNTLDQEQNWAVSWTSLDPYDLDTLPAVNVPTLTELMLHRFICAMQHLYMVTKSPVLTRLTKLDISHSSGITGTLSILLCHKFPSLSHLTLSNCGLNYQDLRSLAYSEHKGRLPQLRHLDISANTKTAGKLISFFEFNCKWSSLISLNVEGTSSKCFQYLGEKVASGFLSSLEKVGFSITEKTMSYKGGQWNRLTHLKVSSKVCETHNILSVARQLVDQGVFPSLSVLTLCAGKKESDKDDSDTDSSAVLLAQALHSSPLGTYIYDVLDQIALRTQAFLGSFAAKIHAVSSPESSYQEILDEMAAIEACLFDQSLRQDVPQSQREQLKEAYEQHLLAMAPDKVTNRRSDSEKRDKYFKGMEHKRALMTRNIALFMFSEEFVSGW